MRLTLITVVIAVACPACLGSGGGASPTTQAQSEVTHPVEPAGHKPVLVPIPPVKGRWPRDPPPPIASAPVRLSAPPRVVVDACRAAQSKTTMPVLCPSL